MTITEWIEANIDMDRSGYRLDEVVEIAMRAIAYGLDRSHKDAMASIKELSELLNRKEIEP